MQTGSLVVTFYRA